MAILAAITNGGLRRCEELTARYLHTILRYEPETGHWFWLVDRGRHCAGDRAGNLNTSTGYVRIKIDQVTYKAHRLAFLYVYGCWPPKDMDHINRVRSDNRWCNLREATPSQNGMNRPQTSKRSELPRGVRKQRGRFGAQINNTYLGTYNSPEIASSVREEIAREQFGDFYHEP